jgi:hypothetical protein
MTEAAPVEAFAALLEQTGRHHRRPEDVEPDLLTLVDVTRRLARVEAPTPRPAFRAELLARLMEVCERDGLGETEVPARAGTVAHEERAEPAGWPVLGGAVAPRPRRGADDVEPSLATNSALANQRTQFVRVVRQRLAGRTRLAAVIGLAAGALAISGVSMASTGALPGDALYGVKRSGEQAQLLLAGSDADRGRLHLDFARIRLVEARQVEQGELSGVLAAMDREIAEGARLLFSAGVEKADASLIESVGTFAQEQRAEVIRLQADLAADEPTQRTLELLTAVEIRANELRAALADGCAIAPADDLGPRPAC